MRVYDICIFILIALFKSDVAVYLKKKKHIILYVMFSRLIHTMSCVN